mmetsp:Transcript_49717/g.89283  ORF Transcript_49717/g.89283 Transcript_49717/m.89283 type:complete len:301 (+) Transcript_49717:83-985(+)
MGAAASVDLKTATDEELQKIASELSAEAKIMYSSLLTGDGKSDEVSANMKRIKENKGKLYEIEAKVMENKQMIYGERSYIEENRQLILKNYAAAFMGNRQIANTNTDDIFKNRYAILKTLKTSSQVEVNFRESKINEAKVDFLDHRSKLNAKVEAVSEKMAAANALLIEVNDAIMESNAEIVAFNADSISTNSKLLEAGILAEKATPEANAARIQSNSDRMAAVLERATANAAKVAEIMEKAKANRAHILENSEKIYARREEMMENHAKIAKNALLVAARIHGNRIAFLPTAWLSKQLLG